MLIFLTADIGGQLGLFCGASVITIIEIIEYIFTNFYWMCIFLLLKIPEVTESFPPQHNHLQNKNRIEECWCLLNSLHNSLSWLISGYVTHDFGSPIKAILLLRLFIYLYLLIYMCTSVCVHIYIYIESKPCSVLSLLYFQHPQ